MLVENFTSVAGYTCPLCGKDVERPILWSLNFGEHIQASYDIPSCCHVIVGWVWLEGLPVYVGTFRTSREFARWFMAPGEYSHLSPAGRDWDSETQTINKRDIDEIPF